MKDENKAARERPTRTSAKANGVGEQGMKPPMCDFRRENDRHPRLARDEDEHLPHTEIAPYGRSLSWCREDRDNRRRKGGGAGRELDQRPKGGRSRLQTRTNEAKPGALSLAWEGDNEAA